LLNVLLPKRKSFFAGSETFFDTSKARSRRFQKKFLLACGTIRQKTQADKKAFYLFEGAKLELLMFQKEPFQNGTVLFQMIH
jgi:hypothetical protein